MSLKHELLGAGGVMDRPDRKLFVGDGMRHRLGTRTCDGCDLCCIAMGVEEIAKPPDTRCIHLDGKAGCSCAIYPDRPTSCRTFACMWVRFGYGDVLPDDMQPAACGFVVAHVAQGHGSTGKDMFTVYLDPERPESWRRPRYLNQLKRLARIGNLMVVIGAGDGARAVIGPRGGVFLRERRPDLFDGLSVGCPKDQYL